MNDSKLPAKLTKRERIFLNALRLLVGLGFRTLEAREIEAISDFKEAFQTLYNEVEISIHDYNSRKTSVGTALNTATSFTATHAHATEAYASRKRKQPVEVDSAVENTTSREEVRQADTSQLATTSDLKPPHGNIPPSNSDSQTRSPSGEAVQVNPPQPTTLSSLATFRASVPPSEQDSRLRIPTDSRPSQTSKSRQLIEPGKLPRATLLGQPNNVTNLFDPPSINPITALSNGPADREHEIIQHEYAWRFSTSSRDLPLQWHCEKVGQYAFSPFALDADRTPKQHLTDTVWNELNEEASSIAQYFDFSSSDKKCLTQISVLGSTPHTSSNFRARLPTIRRFGEMSSFLRTESHRRSLHGLLLILFHLSNMIRQQQDETVELRSYGGNFKDKASAADLLVMALHSLNSVFDLLGRPWSSSRNILFVLISGYPLHKLSAFFRPDYRPAAIQLLTNRLRPLEERLTSRLKLALLKNEYGLRFLESLVPEPGSLIADADWSNIVDPSSKLLEGLLPGCPLQADDIEAVASSFVWPKRTTPYTILQVPNGRTDISPTEKEATQPFFIPIAYDDHWSLLLVDPVTKFIRHFDSASVYSTNSAHIACPVCRHVAEQLPLSSEHPAWTLSIYDDIQQRPFSPPQTKEVDCGVVMLHNFICLTRGDDPWKYPVYADKIRAWFAKVRAPHLFSDEKPLPRDQGSTDEMENEVAEDADRGSDELADWSI